MNEEEQQPQNPHAKVISEARERAAAATGRAERLVKTVNFRISDGIYTKLIAEAKARKILGREGEPSPDLLARQLVMESLGYV